MAGNIPGLNEQMMRQLMKQRGGRSQAPSNSPAAGLAEDEYMRYKNMATPAMKKMMWPSLALSLITDPSISGTLAKGVGKIAPAAGKFLGASGSNLGALGALGYLGPKVISEGLKSRRHAYEKTQPRMGGMAGNTLKGLELASSIDYLMRLPGWASVLGGMKTGTLLGKSPRIANWLTGSAKNVMAGKGSAAVEGGGVLNKGYEGLKHTLDWISGGNISAAMAGAAKKGGIAGAAAGGAGLLNKGISGLLSSPMGVMMGMAGLQVGLSIYKSVKMAKLTPNRQAPDKYARNFYNPAQTSTSLTKILTMNPAAKDPQSMGFVLQQKTFMVQQLVVQELMRLNMQVAGFRGEYHTENDFVRQEKEKGESNFSERYGTDVYGEDDRGVIMKGLDRLSHTITKAKNTFDPFTQLTNFAFGLLRGKMILPGTEVSKIAKIYGFDDENKMMKERSESFGIAMDQTRLLHTPGRSVLEMAQTYESKMMALGVAQFDINRYMLAELMTIRISGYGIDQNILHRKEPGAFKQFMTDMFEKLNPMNLPGVNALFNIVKGVGKFAFQTLPNLPTKIMEGVYKGSNAITNALFGDEYNSMDSVEQRKKAAGLLKDDREVASEFISRGLPQILNEVRHIQFSQLEVQQNLLDIQIQMLELQGRPYDYKETQAGKKDLLVWDSVKGRFNTIAQSDKIETERQRILNSKQEEGFSKGILGKLLFLKDVLTPGVESTTLAAGMSRMGKAESFKGQLEEFFTGERRTFKTSEMSKIISKDLTSLQPRVGLPETSEIEENTRREFKFNLTQYLQDLGRSSGVLGVSSAMLLITSLGPAAAFALIATAASVGIDLWKTKRIAQKAAKGKGYYTEEEKYMKEYQLVTNRSAEERAKERGAGIFTRHMSTVTGLSPVQQTNEHLAKIQSYLGKSDTNNVFTLLKPGTPDIAEVTIVDKQRKPIFIGGETSKSQMGTLYHIQDYLGKDKNIFTSLQPGGEAAEVGLHQDNIYQLSDAIGSKVAAAVGRRAKGGPVSKDDPVLVGEEGPEILMPRSAGVVIPNNKIDKFAKGGILGGILGAHELSMQGKLGELEEKKEKEKDSNWKKEVVSLLGRMIPTKNKKEGSKEEGGFFQTIWDFLKNNGGMVIGGILATILGGLLLKFVDVGSILKSVGGFISDALQGMSSLGRVGMFAITGAGIGAIGGPMGMLYGALIGGAIGGVVDSIYDMISGYKKEGILGGISTFLTGSVPGELSSVGGNMSKWAMMGAVVGLPFGGPVGMIAGALIGGAIGGALAVVQNMFVSSIAAGKSGGIMAGITTFLTGAPPGEMASVGGNIGKWALMGSVIGLPFGGPIGMVIGGLIGGALGGVMALVQNLLTSVSESSDTGWIAKMNEWVISKFSKVSPLAGKMAQYGSFTGIPFFGPLLGGIYGTIFSKLLDIFSGLLDFDMGRKLKDKMKAEFPKLYKFFFEKDEGVTKEGDVDARIAKKAAETSAGKTASSYGNIVTAGGQGPTTFGSQGGGDVDVKGAGAATIDKLAPSVAANFIPMAAAFKDKTKRDLQVNSVFRTDAEQAKLYKERPGFAAPPGQSLHGFGGLSYAIDAQSKDIDELDRLGLLSAYGFTRPMAKEPWHMQPIGISKKEPEMNAKGTTSGSSIAAGSGSTDFMGTVTGAFSDIGKAAMDIMFKNFNDTGIKKSINVANATNVIAENQAAKEQAQTVIAAQGPEKTKRSEGQQRAMDARAKQVMQQVEEAKAKIMGNVQQPNATVQRGSFGTEITSSFSMLEKDIFGSLDMALIGGTTKYPFGSEMQHVA